ncbi:hypothetical protein BBJ28_00002896 [Nothophytophthora sp. Chile5]|nr:hypothetical protein BBJ28_00002896 [Nothophytophthora sp. Chile5]
MMQQQQQELQAAAVPSRRAADDGETQTSHTSGNIHRAGVASLPGAPQPPLQPATGRTMKRPRDGAPPAAQGGGGCDAGQGVVALVWSEEASRQLLQLRFQRLWRQFDAAQTATQLHEAWELLAAQLSGTGLGCGFDVAQCVAQLAKLRQLWEDEQRNTAISNSQEQNTLPLYALLAESFSWEAAMTSGQQPSSLPATSGSELSMAMAVADQAPPEVEAPPKRRKAPVRRRKATPPAPAALSVPPRRPVNREIARADEILLGLEKQAVLLERQTRAHQQQGDVMQKLLEVLAARMANAFLRARRGFAGVWRAQDKQDQEGAETIAREAGAMFKRFSVEEHMSTSSKVKSSQQRSIRSKVLEQYPELEPYAELLMPKKAPMVVAKW